MEIRKVKINPEVASKMIENNHVNRTLSKSHVEYLSRLMKDDLWKTENGDLIRFSKTKRLLDGQHRLNAIIHSGVTLELWCAYNLDEDVFEYIDAGKNRSGGDVLKIAGIPNSNNIARVVKQYQFLKNGITGAKGSRKQRISNHEVLELYNTNPEIYIDSVRKSALWYKNISMIIPLSLIATYYLYFKDFNNVKVDDFFDKLCKGIGISTINDPVKRLRDKLYFAKVDKTKKITPKYMYVYFVKTWNLYLKNKEARLLRYVEGDNIPIPLKF